MKKSIHSILMGAMLMLSPAVFTSCGNQDNPLFSETTVANVSTALEEGSVVSFTFLYKGTTHTSTFKKVGDKYVLQGAPLSLDTDELKAIEELLVLDGGQTLQFSVYLDGSEEIEVEEDESEFEVIDDTDDDDDDEPSTTRGVAGTRVMNDVVGRHGLPCLVMNVDVRTERISPCINDGDFDLPDNDHTALTINGSAGSGKAYTLGNNSSKKFITVKIGDEKRRFKFNQGDTWQTIIDDFEKAGLQDYLFERDGYVIMLVTIDGRKNKKTCECWLKNNGERVKASDEISSNYKYEKIMTRVNSLKSDYTVEDKEVLTGKLKKYRIIIPDGYTITLFDAKILYGKKKNDKPAIECEGAATIIVADGTNSKVSVPVKEDDRIAITASEKLIIKGQTAGTGTLNVHGNTAIAANDELEIEGCQVKARGKNYGVTSENGFTVKGNDTDVYVFGSIFDGIFGKVIVEAGLLTVKTGAKDEQNAGIRGEITITGGSIDVTATKNIAIIGDIDAQGGTLTAQGGKNKKAIVGTVTLGTEMRLYKKATKNGSWTEDAGDSEHHAQCGETDRFAEIKKQTP